MHPLGRYTWNPIVLALIGLTCMIVLLAAPYGIIKYSDDGFFAGADDETIKYDDVEGDSSTPDLLKPETILAGSIIVMIGGLALTLLGFVPSTTNVARFAGYAFALIAGVGALLLTTASFFTFGGSAFMVVGSWTGADFGVTFWAVSTVITSVLSLGAFYAIFNLMPKLTSTEDGARDESSSLSRNGMVIAGVLALGCFVPWSMMTADGMDGAIFVAAGEIYADNAFFGGVEYDGIKSFIQLLLATTFIGILSIWLMQLGIMLRGSVAEAAGNMTTAILNVANGVLFIATAVYFLNAITWLFHPGWGKPEYEGVTFMPGWFNFALIPLLVFWGLTAIPAAQKALSEMQSWNPEEPTTDTFGS